MMLSGAQMMSMILVFSSCFLLWIGLLLTQYSHVTEAPGLHSWSVAISAKSVIIPGIWGNPLIAWVTCLTLKASLWAERSSVLIGYTRVIWGLSHTSHLHWERRKGWFAKEKSGCFFQKRQEAKATNVLIAACCSGSLWGKLGNFGKFYI